MEIQQEINPLNYNRIFLETSLKSLKEKYFKNFKENKDEIIKIQNELNNIYSKLKPLFENLRKLQCKYLIEYEGQVFDPIINSYRWNKESEIFYFLTCCSIDTLINGWDAYLTDTCVQELITEIHGAIYKLRYTNFNIINVKNI